MLNTDLTNNGKLDDVVSSDLSAMKDFIFKMSMTKVLSDYTANQGTSGKQVGKDFFEGKVTLPAIIAYEKGSPAEQKFWEKCFSSARHNFDQALHYINHHNAIQFFMEKARYFINMAQNEISTFFDSFYKITLIDFLNASIERQMWLVLDIFELIYQILRYSDTSDSSKEKKRKFADILNRQKGDDQQSDNHKQTDDLNEDLNTLKERAAQLEDHLRRAVADNENVKRIMQKKISDASDYAVTKFARDMIDSCDNLKKGMEILKDGDPVHKGIDVAYQKIISDLKKHGIEEVDPLGELFESNLHQAVVEREDNEKEPGTIIEVLQTSYTIKNRLLRPAMVILYKKSADYVGDQHEVNV